MSSGMFLQETVVSLGRTQGEMLAAVSTEPEEELSAGHDAVASMIIP